MIKVWKLILMTVTLCIITTGCWKQKEMNGKTLPAGIIQVTPSKLFEGDIKKLEPHLGMTTGCVKIKYHDVAQSVCSLFEIWEDGIKKETYNSVGNAIESKFDGELSISLISEREEDDEKLKITTVMSDADGYSGCTFRVPKFSEKYGYAPKVISDVIEIAEGKDTAVWGLYAWEGGIPISNSESFEERAKRCAWALVLKVTAKESLDHK